MLLCLFFKRHMHKEDSGFSTAFSRAVNRVTSLTRASRRAQDARAGTEPLLAETETESSVALDESASAGTAEHQIGEWNGGLSAEEMQRLRTNLFQPRTCCSAHTCRANAVAMCQF